MKRSLSHIALFISISGCYASAADNHNFLTRMDFDAYVNVGRFSGLLIGAVYGMTMTDYDLHGDLYPTKGQYYGFCGIIGASVGIVLGATTYACVQIGSAASPACTTMYRKIHDYYTTISPRGATEAYHPHAKTK